MKELEMKEQVCRALNAQLSSLRTSPAQRDRLARNAMEGRKVKKTKVSLALVLALVLCLLTAGALAAVLLSGREIVEQVAVPIAQSSKQENYTYEELKTLIQTLNENGITLDEGSTLMQAFQAGHGYWERDTIDEICRAAFDGDLRNWTIEQMHWYGEMMTAIGAWEENIWLLPEEGDMTVEEARAYAAKALKDAYGADLPAESSDQWRISENFDLTWMYDDEAGHEEALWSFWYINLRTGNNDYNVTFDRSGGHITTWRADYLEKISTKNWGTVMDDLQSREGTCTQWGVETWAEFGELVKGMEADSRNGWLYLHAGYRLPPEGSISPERALEIAGNEMRYGEITGRLYENVICCTDGDRPIYKVCHRVIFRQEDLEKGGAYDDVWCLEIDCMSGEVLSKRQYAYGPDGDPMMMYVPFSLLEQAPPFEEKPADTEKEQAAQKRYEKEEAAIAQYGADMYFWPLQVQAEVYGEPCGVPTEAEYARALKIALDAIAKQYGKDAMTELGDYRVGLMHRRFDDEKENGCWQLEWDFMFTTDPEFLSDGYRVQFRQLIYEEDSLETIRDMMVEHANFGNG